MEFLKEVFGSEALTYDQLAEKLNGSATVKLGNLAGGAYVGKDKYAALEAKLAGVEEQLTNANTKLEGYDPEWKAKAEQASREAEARVAAVQFDALLDSAIIGAKAKSAKAVRGVLADQMDTLRSSKNQEADIKAALEGLKKENGFLFEECSPVRTGMSHQNAQEVGGDDKKEAANEALRSVFGRAE